jgi:ADP-heptose:LPS heptosyltransferase
VLNPNGLCKSRIWDKSNYLKLVKRLKEYKIIIVGREDDIDYNKDFKDCINITGKTTLFHLAALFSIADLLITGDSGTLHIAISEGCKILSLWGATDPMTRLPLDQEHNYIYHEDEPGAGEYNMEHESFGNNVINTITIDEVYNRII